MLHVKEAGASEGWNVSMKFMRNLQGPGCHLFDIYSTLHHSKSVVWYSVLKCPIKRKMLSCNYICFTWFSSLLECQNLISPLVNDFIQENSTHCAESFTGLRKNLFWDEYLCIINAPGSSSSSSSLISLVPLRSGLSAWQWNAAQCDCQQQRMPFIRHRMDRKKWI